MIANLLCPRALRYIFGLTLLATAARAQTPVITTASDFGTIPVGVADLNFSATGGNGTYSWSLTGGSLPPNTVLRTDLNTTSSTISAVVSGVVEVPGTYTFTLQVTSGGSPASKTFTVKVANLTLKERSSTNAMPDGFVNSPFTYTLTPVRNTGTVTFAACGAASMNLPPGMALSAGGVLSGTPTANGNFALNFSITDSADSVCFTPTIRIFTVQVTSPGQLLNATQFQTYAGYTVTASGGTGPYTFTVGSGVPGGMSVNSAGLISGTPTGTGRFSFNVTAKDANQVTYTKTMNLYVLGSPATQPSLFAYGNYDDCALGLSCSRPLGVSTGGTAPFTWTVTGMPPGMSARFGSGATIASVTPSDVEIWGTPLTAGLYTMHAVATDNNGISVAQDFKLRISEIGVDSASLPALSYQHVYSATDRLVGGTAPYSVQVLSGSLPGGITATGSAQGIGLSGTPTENGSFSAVLLVTDAASKSFQFTLSLTVSGASGTTINVSQANIQGPYTLGSFSLQFTATGATSYVWSLVSGTLPPGLTFNAIGLLSGTMTTAGTYSFVVQATDQTNPANFGVRAITMEVSAVVPATAATLPYANVGVAYTQTLTATGGVGSITWSLMPLQYLPPGFSLTTGGVLSGTATSTGIYFFTVKVQDSTGAFDTRQYSVAIYPLGVTPPLGLNIGPTLGPSIIGVQTIQMTASGGTPPYHFSYAPSATVIPGMRVLDGQPLPTSFPSTTTGGFAGVITAPGLYTTTLRVTDAAAATFDRAITWTVLTTVPLSQSALPKGTVGTPYSFTFVGYGGSGNFSWTSSNLPPGLIISTGGVISGTPTAAGSFSSTVTIADLTSSTSIGFTETIIVNPFSIDTGAVLPQGTISAAYAQMLAATNCGSGCTWTVASGSLPSGITLSSAGLLSGTPTGFYNSGFLVQAAGSNGTTQKEFALRINFNTIQPLFISQTPDFGTAGLSGLISSALNVQGGTPPYVWSLDSGSLPPGIILTGPGETLGANLLPGFTYLAGRAMQVGNYTFTLKVTDGVGGIATQTFTWSVPPLLINILSFPIANSPLVYNTAYSQQLLVLGGTGNYTSWTVVSGAMPTGLTLNAGTGLVSGTPTNTGSFTPRIQVTDSAANTTRNNVTFTVAGTSGVVINAGNSDSSTAQSGTTTTLAWSPSGGTGPYTYAPVTALPPGCGFEFGNTILSGNNNTYALVCTPLAVGDFTFTFQITDSVGNTGVRTMTLHVTPFTLFSSTSLPNGSVGSPYSAAILAWDNSSAITWTVAAGSALPQGISIAGSAFTGTPTVAGNYSFVLTATDASGLTINYTFTLFISTIHITNPDIIPVQAIFNVSFTYAFAATGGGGALTWTATGLPSGITMGTNGTLSGTPTSTGTFRITVTVTDGTSTLVRAFTLFSRYTDPTLPGYTPSGLTLADARLGASVSYTLSPTGGTPPFTWAVASGSSLPAGLNLYSGTSLSVYSSGQTTGLTYLQGAPTAAGSYSFDLIATDSAGVQMRRTFTLRVSPMALMAGGLRTPVTGTPYSEQLTVLGGTPPYTFTYSILGINTDLLPQGLTASSSGLISGTPASVGNFGFFATVQDNAGHTYTGSYSYSSTNSLGLNITSPIPFGLSAGTGYSITLATTGSSTYTWSIAAGSLPPGLSLVPSGSSTVLTGAPSTAGTYTYTLRAVDNANASNVADRVFTVPVSPMQFTGGVNVLSVYLPPATVGTPYTYTYKIAGGTPPYTFTTVPTIYPLPAGLTLSSAGVLSGTPQQSGSFFFYFVLSDTAGYSGRVFGGNLNVLGAGQNNPVEGLSVTLHAATVGAPYAVYLDPNVQGGVPPFTWSVAAGSSLPAGMTILPGSNGVTSYLGGIPTAFGAYNFTLRAMDAVGQTALAALTLTVSPILVTPSLLPNGTVGSPYSTTLTATGGIAPYTFQFSTGSSVPPGVTLSTGGVLSGTPTGPGYFKMGITVTDSVGESAGLVLPVVIDAAGAAQGIGISPNNTIQINYVIGSASPSPLAVTISATSGTLAYAAMVNGIPGASLSATSGTATGIVNLNVNTAGTAAGTYAGVLAVSSPLSANLNAKIPVVLNVTAACTYVLNPTAFALTAPGGVSSFSVTVATGCAWTPVSSDTSWIAVTSGTGPGAGTVNFSVAANLGTSQRTGTITLAGQTFSIIQGGNITTPPGAGLRFVPITPCRIADTRGPAGPYGGPSLADATPRNFDIRGSGCGIPSTAQAYSLNLTVVPLGPLGFLSVWPAGQSQPVVSTLNSLDGRIKANAAIVPAGTGGAITLFGSNATHIIVDINGYFVPAVANNNLAFYPLTPCRIADTRLGGIGTFNGPALAAGVSRDFPLLSSACGIPATAQAYALNMTVVPGGPLGFLSAWPAGLPQPPVSTLNAPTGAVTANAAIVPAGTGGAITLIATNTTHVIIDINGYFAPPGSPGGMLFYTATPCRIVDTRGATGPFGGPLLPAAASREFGVAASACNIPATAGAYSLNATVVPPAGLGFLSLWGAGSQPVVSTLNDSDGTIVANAALVPASSTGSVTAFASNLTQLILDINGYFAQ